MRLFLCLTHPDRLRLIVLLRRVKVSSCCRSGSRQTCGQDLPIEPAPDQPFVKGKVRDQFRTAMRPFGDYSRSSSSERGNLAYTAKIIQRMMGRNRWLQLPEIAKLFGLSEDSIKRLAKNHGLPLRRVSPLATPGALESELEEWLKGQPLVGPPVRSKRRIVRKR